MVRQWNAPARRRRTQNQRAEIFLAHDGICGLCDCKIHPGEKWDLDHEAALEISEDDSDDNLRPVHEACHKAKTAEDKAAIAKSNRVRAKHLTGRGKAPSGRGFRGWKRFDGTPVWANERNRT